MKYLIILFIIIVIYYQVYQKYPEILLPKHHFYFTVFLVFYLIMYYFLSYQKKFIYNILKNVKETDQKELYDSNSLIYKKNQMDGLRYNLAMRQGWRCFSCNNHILPKDIHIYRMHYIKPLQYGGENNVNNIGLKCPRCSEFGHF